MNRFIFLNWDFWCEWIGFQPDIRVHAVWDDVQ